MVCLHGFIDSWRTWELVLPALETRHDVLAPTMTGHAGGPKLVGEIDQGIMADGVERAMDEAGFETAHIVGNSLGGFVALQLAARGRARSVVALCPAGGWRTGALRGETLRQQVALLPMLQAAVPFADALVATAAGRRRGTQMITVNYEHIPPALLAHQLRAAAACEAVPLIEYAAEADWELDAASIDCPVRVVWGLEDRLLPWPSAAERFREEWLPHADWVELDGVGHCPQLDVPLETAQLILGFTAPS
jgi:pimeloyl-ACP methyl ester carboxylesterase